MSLKERLLEDMKTAMKDKDNIKKNSVQMVRSAVLQIEKDKKISLDDDGVIDVIAKEVKKRKDSLPEYEKSGRQDLVDNLQQEIDILLQYLPQQLSDDEVEAIVKEIVDETGINSKKDIGKLMQAVMPRVKGIADGKVVNRIVSKYLQ
ncbi:MAG TPA: GatB/YqeY domain-containing protein [Clostridia bacterium]